MKRLFIILLVAVTLSAHAQKSGRKNILGGNPIDSLWSELAVAHTPADSIKILFNLYDLNSSIHSVEKARKDNKWILSQLYDVSYRTKDYQSALDAIRYIATASGYDRNNVDVQLRRLATFPESNERREVETLLRLQNYFRMLRDTTLSGDERRENFYKIRTEVEKNKNQKTLYDKIDQHFALVLFGSNLVQNEKLEKYLLDLRRYVETAEDKNDIIKSYYYRIAAILYDEAQNGHKSVEADIDYLNTLNNREAIYRKTGRVYRNYDYTRFTIYRRMLTNYASMHPDSVRNVYSQLQVIMKNLPPDQLAPKEKMSVEAMWAMFNKQYDKALPILRELMSSKPYNSKPPYLLSYIQAASALQAISDLEIGQQKYTEMILERAREAADTEYARMRIEYEIDTLEASAVNAKQHAKALDRKSEEMSNTYFQYALIAIGVFLLILLILQRISSLRRRRVANQLRESNLELKKERDLLRATKNELEKANENSRKAIRQKSEFIQNISHEISEPAKAIVGFTQLITDSIPQERRKYLEGFVDIVNLNCDILQRIVGDILESAEIEGSVNTVTVTHFQLENACRLVAETMQPRLNENQSIVVEKLLVNGKPSETDYGVDNDARRLDQILSYLLSNAIKFSPKGTITLRPEIDTLAGTMSVSVTDQGPGIPAGKEDVIFEKYEKLGHFSSGLGLGLYISRELARLLGGTVDVDTTRRHGARFIVTLPINLHIKKGKK